MIFQALSFGEPFAFAQNQDNWRLRPRAAVDVKAEALITLEPLWSVFVPSSNCFWGNDRLETNPVFSMRLANPIYFSAAVLVAILGGWRGWLNRNELLLSGGLLVIPYLTRSFDMCFCSMGRFSAAAFPLYIAMGQLLCRLPPGIAAAGLALSAVFMGLYAALFAAGYRFF